MPEQSIWVVDDDLEFGRLVLRSVSKMGYGVTQISDPREVMQRYDERTAPDVIFLDIFMPHLDGIDVAKRLIAQGFKGKLVFMTGQNAAFLSMARQIVERSSEAHVVELEKPFRVSQIRDILSEKRTKPRAKFVKSARISDPERRGTMACIVLDLSRNGAKLKPSQMADLPTRFRLLMADAETYDCEVVWREGDQIAVRFV